MAFVFTCDNSACKATVDSGSEGRPMVMAKRHLYCPRCAALMEAVETQLRVEATEKALRLSDEIEQRRRELMAQMLPETVFPVETAPAVPRGAPQTGAWLIAVPGEVN